MRLSTLLGISLLALTPLLAAPVVDAASTDSRSAHVRAELSALRQHIIKVRKQIAADSGQRKDLSQALADAQTRISSARKRLDSLDHGIAKHQQRIARLKKQRDAERDDLSDDLSTLRAQVRAAYETGRMSRMRLLLSGSAPEHMGRMLTYYRYFSNAQSDLVAHLKTVLAQLASKQQSLENERAQLVAQRHTRAKTLKSLQETEKKQKSTLAALDKQLSTHRTNLSDMKDQEKKLKHLLDSINKQMSNLPPVPSGVPFYKLKGRMHPPVSGKALASYGKLKHGGPLRWQGDWYAASKGSPVHAVAGGRVVYVGFLKGYGLIVIINHGHGYYSLYGHAATSYVDVGDAVSTGQEIATAGHSGGHHKNGVYFEIRHGQDPVNPAHWLGG